LETQFKVLGEKFEDSQNCYVTSKQEASDLKQKIREISDKNDVLSTKLADFEHQIQEQSTKEK
jgi:hypothetical protein